MQFSQLLNTDFIICNAEASSYNAACDLLLKRYAAKGGKSVETVKKTIFEHDKPDTTLLAPGLGILHGRLHEINDLFILIGVFPSGIVIAPGRPLVYVVIMFLIPEAHPTMYLCAIKALSKVLINDDSRKTLIKKLVESSSSENIISVFEQERIYIDQTVTVGDIMTLNPVCVQSEATLCTVADIMLKHGFCLYPVLDKNGNYIGTATTRSLLRTGLPDYMLSLENYAFITNSEPFEDFFKNENTLTALDILDDKVVTLYKTTPMIVAVAKITESNFNSAIVLEQNHPVGIVSLADFINRVIRL